MNLMLHDQVHQLGILRLQRLYLLLRVALVVKACLVLLFQFLLQRVDQLLHLVDLLLQLAKVLVFLFLRVACSLLRCHCCALFFFQLSLPLLESLLVVFLDLCDILRYGTLHLRHGYIASADLVPQVIKDCNKLFVGILLLRG